MRKPGERRILQRGAKIGRYHLSAGDYKEEKKRAARAVRIPAGPAREQVLSALYARALTAYGFVVYGI